MFPSETFSSNSEVFASELLEKLEEMYLQYCMHNDSLACFPTTQGLIHVRLKTEEFFFNILFF